ncbi:acyltransferase family protein [Corynebacterium lizhenjunii]|uniref:acyltransferase family protein n=1 Tax=Corynebacterium lizhenjunii TaxID=2709394 RepID=UPI0013EC573F
MAITLPQHLPALDGLRAVAALGVMVTHVSFQTATGWALAERLDYCVAVFFMLSAFVLWRRGPQAYVGPAAGRYARARIARLAPGYLVCVAVVLALLPGAHFSAIQVASNLTATQIYVADGLAPGLTHLWSLCVEFAFYAFLPAAAWLLRARPRRTRILWIAAVGVTSLAWGWLVYPWEQVTEVNVQIFPPAYGWWFALGMLAAEAEPRMRPWLSAGGARSRRALVCRCLGWSLAAASIWLASREWFGPQGLEHPSPAEFARRIAVGGVCAAAVVLPYAWGAGSRLLESRLLQVLGRWSYAIFLWHVAVLWVAFPLLGMAPFQGGFFRVGALTLAGTLVVAALSYSWVEAPAQAWLRADKLRYGKLRAGASLVGATLAGTSRAGMERTASVPNAAAHRKASSQESPA